MARTRKSRKVQDQVEQAPILTPEESKALTLSLKTGEYDPFEGVGQPFEDEEQTMTNEDEEPIESEEQVEKTTPAQPVKGWTPEKRAALAEKMRAHWQTHEHPLKGVSMAEEQKAVLREKALERYSQGGTHFCGRCSKQLFDSESIRLGIGPECRRKG